MSQTFVSIDGRRLEVAEFQGDKALAPLVLLHEGLGSVGLWRGFPDALARRTGRRTVAFSRFGHGRSDSPPSPRTPSFMHEEAYEVLPAVLSSLEIADPVLVGHSDGASIALIHASRFEVRGVVALAPHVFVEECTIEGIRSARAEFDGGALRVRMARHHEDPVVTFSGWCDVWLDPSFRQWNIEDVLARVSAPVLLIQGDGDQYGTFAQLDAIERGVRGPVSRLVVPGGHAPHLEQPEEVVAAVARFVAGLAG